MHNLTVAQQVKGLVDGEFSSMELTQHYIDRIEAHDGLINSFITFTPDLALESARDYDQNRGQGILLGGIPVALKDIFCTDGTKTTCASRMLDQFIAPYDATVVTKLKQAGAVV